MDSGIYLILQVSTGRHYIGSAVQLERRWDRHRADLKAERHHNQKLQRAWLKYGEADFEFQIIERCEEDRLIEREQYWLDQTMPFFNVLRKAYSAAGYRHSDAAKVKMSIASKRAWENMTPEQREEKSKRHAEAITGLRHTEETRRRMSEAHKANQRTPEQLANLELRNTPEARAKRAEARAGEYIVTDPAGVEFEVKNLSAFCRTHKLNQAHMNAAARGMRRGDKGWLCRYKNDPIPYDDSRKPRYDVFGKLLTVAEIAALIGLHKNTVRHHINKRGIDSLLPRISKPEAHE